MVSGDEPLLQLLRILKSDGYGFVAVTPATHARVVSRPLSSRPTLRDIFGWNRLFTKEDVDPELLACLRAADAVEAGAEGLRSKLRVASLGDDLFVHGAYPTDAADSVFFGPDTYRFARWIAAQLGELSEIRWLVDMGAGTGAGAIAAARSAAVQRTTLVDINESALRYAAINAQAAGIAVETLHAAEMPAGPDVMIANPPYLMDRQGRAYRDGGALLGGELALDWCRQALGRLAPGGRILLYTGAAIVDGKSPLLEEMVRACDEAGAAISIEEIDVDVFGEELSAAGYGAVERIGAYGITIRTAQSHYASNRVSPQ